MAKTGKIGFGTPIRNLETCTVFRKEIEELEQKEIMTKCGSGVMIGTKSTFFEKTLS